jgi:hypothetical protein
MFLKYRVSVSLVAVACAMVTLSSPAGCGSAGSKPLLPARPGWLTGKVIQAPWRVSPEGWVRVRRDAIDARRKVLGDQMLSLWGGEDLTLIDVWKRPDALPRIEYFVFNRVEAFDSMSVVFAYDTDTGEIVEEFQLPRPGSKTD